MHKNHNYKIGLYVRVSTEEQAQNPEGSIKSQEQRLREAVEYKNRYSQFGNIVGVYIDAGISAKDMNRPKLREMLTAVKAKQIDLVMVTELSRLSRDMHDFISMWNLMRDEKCGFMSLREDFDTSTAAGEMLMFLLANFAQFERRQISERVIANLTARAARGLYNGGPVPIGYKLIPDRPGYLDIDEIYAPIVKLAFDTFLREGCLSHTARWLNNNQYKLKIHVEGGSGKHRVGYFTIDNLCKMLKNKSYLGIKIYKERGDVRETKAVWDAIIDEVTFHRVGELLAKNRSQYKPVKNGFAPYLLTGVSFCKTCGDKMSGRSATGKQKKVMYYEHTWRSKKESCLENKVELCNPHRIQARFVEKVVWEELMKVLKDESIFKSMLSKMQELHSKVPNQDEIDRYKKKKQSLEKQIEALSERLSVLPKSLSAEPIYKQLKRLQDDKRDVVLALEEKSGDTGIISQIVRSRTFHTVSQHYLRLLENCNDQTKKSIIQKIIHRIEIGPSSVKMFWNLSGKFYEKEIELIENKPKTSTPAILAGVFKNNFKLKCSFSLINGVVDGFAANHRFILSLAHQNSIL